MASADPHPDTPDTRWTLIQRTGGQSEGARAALHELLLIYHRSIELMIQKRGLCPGMRVEDVHQSFLAESLAKQQQFAALAPGPKPFRAWLAVAVRNHVLKQVRSFLTAHPKGQACGEFDQGEKLPASALSAAETPECELALAEALDLCEAAVQRMCRQSSRPIDLMELAPYLPGRRCEEIEREATAARLGITINTLNVRIKAARAKFVEALRNVILDGLDVQQLSLLERSKRVDDEMIQLVATLRGQSWFSLAPSGALTNRSFSS